MPADPPPTVTLTSPEGKDADVPADQVRAYTDRGFVPVDTAARAARVAGDVRSNETSVISSAAHGALSGATFGLYDVGANLIGGEDERIKNKQLDEAHPVVSKLSNVAGSLLVGGGVGRVGSAVRGGLGGGLVGAVGGGAVEGGIYGAGNAVSQLALSDDPLTAEHIASTLSSNILLGGAIGGVAGGAFHLGERALTRAGNAIAESAAAKTAIEGVPADLAGLDDAGLKSAREAAVTEHAGDIAAERKSLEDLRVNQRAELANQVHDFHTELATERPIFQAVQGADVEAIPGVKDIQVQMAKSFKTMRAQFDNPIGIARNPESLLRPLEMQQTALEGLQAKAPELQAALGNDARAAALEHVDGALEQNKAFQDQIRSLSPKTPLASGRLTMLEAADSPRMQAIDAAREAMKNAPELGLVGKAAKGAVFGGVTAMAHAIPGVGIAAPFLGKYAADAVGKLFGHLAGSAGAVAEKSAAATQAFLNVAEKVAPFAPMTATKVLGAVRFGAGPEPKSQKLADLYATRVAEVRGQTMYAPDGSTVMRPEARIAMAQKLAPIAAVNPKLADMIETVTARKTAFISQTAPKRPEVGGLQIGPDKYRPPDLAIRSWARTVRACEDPAGVEARLAQGTVTPEDAAAYKAVYPERFAALQQSILTALPTLSKTLPVKRKVALYVFTGIPTMPALQPNVLKVLQGNFAAEPGSAGGSQAPKPMPSFGALGSMKSLDKPTPAQGRET